MHPRKPPRIRNTSFSTTPTDLDIAEVTIESTDANAVEGAVDLGLNNEYQCFIIVPEQHTSPTLNPLQDHTYSSKKKPQMIDASTQTYMSDFIDDSNIGFYTGLPSLSIFLTLVSVIQSCLPKNKFKMVPVPDQILLVLMRLRLGLLYEDLAFRFGVKKGLAACMFSFWIRTISEKLALLISYIPASLAHKCIPSKFKHRFPRLRCIIDCTEIFTERPLKLRTRAQMYSNYKSHQTAKYLVGIAPNGLFTFLSSGFSGRASDLCVVRNSGFLDLIEPFDEIMADRGFNIEDDLKARGARLIIPSFTRGMKQLPADKVLQTRRIANSRIHVERAIARIRTYRILNGNFPITQMNLLDDIMRVICMLCNLKRDLIK